MQTSSTTTGVSSGTLGVPWRTRALPGRQSRFNGDHQKAD
jgi:hypothetical protein